MRGLNHDLMKKVGKILIKTNKQDEITVTYVGDHEIDTFCCKKIATLDESKFAAYSLQTI